MTTQEPLHKETTAASPVWPPPPTVPAPAPTRKLPMTSGELFWGIVGRMTLMGLARGAGLGALVGVFFWIIGAIFGLVIGGAAGLLLGFLDGLVLGALAPLCFRPTGDPSSFRFTLCLVSGLVTLVAGTALVWLITGQNSTVEDGSWVIALVPVGIATIAAAEAGHRVAQWYLSAC